MALTPLQIEERIGRQHRIEGEDRANFYGADLRGCDLSNRDLRRADFRCADCRFANFSGSDL